jgi:hypothetical protein
MLRSREVRRGTRARAGLAWLFFLLGPVAIGSCVPSTLNMSQLERRLERQLADQLDVDGIEVACPAEVEVAEGETFACEARAPGDPDAIRIRVTQVDDDGNVTWEITGTAE